jgi:hypothetical protein
MSMSKEGSANRFFKLSGLFPKERSPQKTQRERECGMKDKFLLLIIFHSSFIIPPLSSVRLRWWVILQVIET